MKYALFIGRWQPFHKGHEWLINQKLKLGIPVLIAIRDMPVDKFNILLTGQVYSMLKYVYEGNLSVNIIIIPDIESVNYGRGVGYEINEHVPPGNIESISGTEIRHYLSYKYNKDWEKLMNPRALEWWKENFKDKK